MWVFAVLGGLLMLMLGICFVCYRMAFYSPPRKPLPADKVCLPNGKIYEAYREQFEKWAWEMRAMPFTPVSVRSFDGLTLTGKFYEYAPGAPIELMFHGYRGNGERDLSGGVQRSFLLGHSVLIVDQRGSGSSEGRTITFGVYEHRDVHSWLTEIRQRWGKEVPVILTGISMGASTVVMAAGKPLSEQVIGVLADCGYHSQKEIIQKVIRQMGLPVKLSYPFVKWGARIFGGFRLEEYTPMEALKTCSVPVLFFHGDRDDFVPYEMSVQMYEACKTRKRLVRVVGAGHGLAYPADPEGYLQAVREFYPN